MCYQKMILSVRVTHSHREFRSKASRPNEICFTALRQAIQTSFFLSNAYVNGVDRVVVKMLPMLRTISSVTVQPVLMITAHSTLYPASLKTYSPRNLVNIFK